METIQQKINKAKNIGSDDLLDSSLGSLLSALERYEQVYKHGFSIENDYAFYKDGELKQAAMFCLFPTIYQWPRGWDLHFKDKILLKSEIERSVIASAFLSSEADRLLYKQRNLL
jgi:hypothetical protein